MTTRDVLRALAVLQVQIDAARWRQRKALDEQIAAALARFRETVG